MAAQRPFQQIPLALLQSSVPADRRCAREIFSGSIFKVCRASNEGIPMRKICRRLPVQSPCQPKSLARLQCSCGSSRRHRNFQKINVQRLPSERRRQYRLHDYNRLLLLIVATPSNSSGDQCSAPGERTTTVFLCAKTVGAYRSNVRSNQYRLHGCTRLRLLVVTAPSKSSREQFSMLVERTTKAFISAKSVGACLSKVHFSKYRSHGCNPLVLVIVTALSKTSGDDCSTPGERTTKAFLCAKSVGVYLSNVHFNKYRLHGCSPLRLLIVTALSKSSGDHCSTPGGRTTKAFLCSRSVGAYLSKVHFSKYRSHGCNALLLVIVTAPSDSSRGQFSTPSERLAWRVARGVARGVAHGVARGVARGAWRGAWRSAWRGAWRGAGRGA